MTSFRFYVGTYTHSGDRKESIFWYRFDPEDGRIQLEGAANGGQDPSFLTTSKDGRFLYAVNELSEFHGQKGGGISAFSIDRTSGGLTFLISQPTFGEAPCYVGLDRDGKWALVANYTGGSLAVYPLLADGRLGTASDFIQHEGHGPNPERQEKAHAHSIQMDPSNRLALAADLGLDQVKLYRLDSATGELHPAQPPFIPVHAAAGPRHFDFHPNGKWMYLVNELDATLTVYAVDPSLSSYSQIQSISTLPADYTGLKWAADVHVHPNGRLVFASNRAHDSLAAFQIDPASGQVSLLGVTPSGGKTPRNFAIDPSGHWLVAANQDSDNLVVFALDASTGQLTQTGSEVSIPAPVCVRFVV